MHWPKSFVLVAGICLFAPCAPVHAQSENPAEPPERRGSQPASEEEVAQLRQEVAELKALILRMVQSNSGMAPGQARLVQASAVTNSAQPDVGASRAAVASSEINDLQREVTELQKKNSETPTAGWNDEHFFLRSSDGNFTLMPLGYLQAQYNVYKGDGAPPDTFIMRRARFGVQGNYGQQLDYAFSLESGSTLTIRDMYLDFKPSQYFNIMGGQYRVPFSQEVLQNETAFEFVDLSINSLLYPNASGAYRTPGVDVHGELGGGHVQYWAGIFNGQGVVQTGTTNEPEIIGKVRLYPFKQSTNHWLKGFVIGGSTEHSRSKALASELSFNGLLPDSSYTFFPQFRINGGIQRYNGFFSYVNGRMGVRGEYTQILEKRTGIGAFVTGGVGFNSLPGVVGKGAYGMATYLLTGETEPENGMPRIKHPVVGPSSPGETGGGPGWGAWQLKFRYSWLEGKAPGSVCDATTIPACPLIPSVVPTFTDHTSQITAGLNWYLNYWVLAKTDLNIDQLKNPSVQGILPRNYFVFAEGLQFRF